MVLSAAEWRVESGERRRMGAARAFWFTANVLHFDRCLGAQCRPTPHLPDTKVCLGKVIPKDAQHDFIPVS